MKTKLTKTTGFIHELDETTQEMMVELIYRMLTIRDDHHLLLSPLLYYLHDFIPNFILGRANYRHIAKFVMYDLVKKLRDVKHEDGKLPFVEVEEDWRYIKNLSDGMVFNVDIEEREDIDEDDFGYAVRVWENGFIVKKILCEDYLSAVQTFFGEIVEFERNHNYITSSYRPE